MIRRLIFSFFLLLSLTARAENDQYTVVISMDGFRWDYPIWYDTPFLDEVAEKGVSSSLIPSFPTKTFPNHYTLATGLYPDHHGIIANAFRDPETGKSFSLGDTETKFDPRYYGGEPVWLTAQKNGLHTAVFYWPGSDVAIKGQYPEHYYNYDAKPQLTFEERVDGIIKQLQKPEPDRPRLIMAYFEQPDAYGHYYGPSSKQTRRAVEQMDSLMRNLYYRIQGLPYADKVNLILLSDHGMTHLGDNQQINIYDYIKKDWIEAAESSIVTNIYVKKGCLKKVLEGLSKMPHVRYWKHGEVPAHFHYGNNPRVGDVIVLEDIGWQLVTKQEKTPGGHGYDNYLYEMHALFRAVGPAFRPGEYPRFENVNVYPLICHLLGIEPAPCDGHINNVKEMLQ